MSNYTKIIKNMADSDYRSDIGISQSMLKEFYTSPSHYKHQFTEEKKVTKAMLVGTATHLACFQPKEFANSVVVSRKFDMRKTDDKIASAKFNEENAGKLILDQEEYDLCMGMADSVRLHPRFIDGCSKGDAEVAVFSDVLPYRDIKIKGKLDWVNWEQECVYDLKTTNVCLKDMYAVRNVISDNLYHLQAAMYLTLLEHNGFKDFRFVFIFVEKAPPFGIRAFEVSEKTLKRQIELLNINLANLQLCIEHDMWPSYEDGITTIDI